MTQAVFLLYGFNKALTFSTIVLTSQLYWKLVKYFGSGIIFWHQCIILTGGFDYSGLKRLSVERWGFENASFSPVLTLQVKDEGGNNDVRSMHSPGSNACSFEVLLKTLIA